MASKLIISGGGPQGDGVQLGITGEDIVIAGTVIEPLDLSLLDTLDVAGVATFADDVVVEGDFTAEAKTSFGGAEAVQLPVASAAQAAVATTAATDSDPFGFAEAQANALVALVNALRAALVTAGIIKGSA